MKNYLKYFVISAAAIGSLTLISCSKDNDEAIDIPTPTPSPETSVAKLSEITIKPTYNTQYKTKFYYDSRNRISSIYEERSSSFDSSPGTMTFSWDPFDFDFNGHKIAITVSSNCFITYINDTSETQTFEYDTSGHLVKWIIKSSGSDYNFSSENTFHWQNDLLIYREEIWQEQEYSGRETYEISYSNKKNISGVYPASFYESCVIFFSLDLNNVSYYCPSALSAGLLGKAPSYLPLEIIHTDHGGSYTDQHIYKIKSDLNSAGLLYREAIDEYSRWNGGASNYMSNTTITYTYR